MTSTGTGFDSSIGWLQESAFNVPGAATRWLPHDSETVTAKKAIVQQAGLRGGTLFSQPATGRYPSTWQAAGNVVMDVENQGMGLLFRNCLGASSSANTGAAYTWTFTQASLLGQTLGCQIIRPSTDGTNNLFNYTGGKITDWQLDLSTDSLLKLTLGLDFADEQTYANAPTGLAIVTAGTPGSTSYYYRVSAVFANGIESGACAEVVIATGNAALSGTNKNNLTWTAVTGAVAYNVYGKTTNAERYMNQVTTNAYSDTGVDTPGGNYANPPVATASSYSSTAAGFSFTECNTLTLGGTAVAAVKKMSIKGTNPSKTDRFYLGSAGIKAEQVGNAWKMVTGTMDCEFTSRAALYDSFQSDQALALDFKVSGGLIATTTSPFSVEVQCPKLFLEGDTPNITGPDILTMSVPFTALADTVGSAGAVTIKTVTSDTAL